MIVDKQQHLYDSIKNGLRLKRDTNIGTFNVESAVKLLCQTDDSGSPLAHKYYWLNERNHFLAETETPEWECIRKNVGPLQVKCYIENTFGPSDHSSLITLQFEGKYILLNN